MKPEHDWAAHLRSEPVHVDYAKLETDAALAVDRLIHQSEHAIMEICNANMRMTKALLDIIHRLNHAVGTDQTGAARDVAIKCLQINIQLSQSLRENQT